MEDAVGGGSLWDVGGLGAADSGGVKQIGVVFRPITSVSARGVGDAVLRNREELRLTETVRVSRSVTITSFAKHVRLKQGLDTVVAAMSGGGLCIHFLGVTIFE